MLDQAARPPHAQSETKTLIFNARLDAFMCGLFLVMVTTIVLSIPVRAWIGILRGTREAEVREAPFVPSRLRAEEV